MLRLRNFRAFARWKEPGNTFITENQIQKANDEFAKLSEREQVVMKAHRKALHQLKKMESEDTTLWWNKLEVIEERELDLMPHGFIKKFGSFINKTNENYTLNKFEENQAFENRWDRVKDLKRLQTDEQKGEIDAWKQANIDNPENTLDDINWEGYMSRQPRFDLKQHNFNFEEYDRYIKLYEEADAEDKETSKNFYKLVKYVKARKGTAEERSNPVVADFLRKYKLDLIEIPEEFQNLEVEDDFKPVKRGRTVPKRKRVLTRSSNDLRNFDAWRCFDRELPVTSGKDQAVAKLEIAPALLKRAFGTPGESHIGFEVTGLYHFEDSNLDSYCLLDYKQTDLYHGLNREDEHYETVSNLKRPLHKRVRKWPTVEEFWASEVPVPFRLMAAEQADWRKFKKWLMKHLRQIESQPDYDYDRQAMQAFSSKIDICSGDYDVKGKVNTSMAIFNYDQSLYMTQAEIDALPDEQKPHRFVPPKMLDLEKDERIIINKDEMKVQEIQAEQEKLSAFV